MKKAKLVDEQLVISYEIIGSDSSGRLFKVSFDKTYLKDSYLNDIDEMDVSAINEEIARAESKRGRVIIMEFSIDRHGLEVA